MLFGFGSAVAQVPQVPKKIQPPSGPMDFTPRKVTTEGDGIFMTYVAIHQGKNYVLLFAMPDWKAIGSAASVTFSKDKVAQASVKLSSMIPPVPFTNEAAARLALRDMVTGTLPKEATNSSITAETPDTLSINGWKSLEAEATFTYYGNVLKRSITLVTLDEKSQLQIFITANARDYEKIHSEALTMLRSWSPRTVESLANAEWAK